MPRLVCHTLICTLQYCHKGVEFIIGRSDYGCDFLIPKTANYVVAGRRALASGERYTYRLQDDEAYYRY
jgi:hypothetical protein